MIINKQNIDRVFVNLKTTFNNAFDSSTAVWQKVAMKVSSSTKVEDYSWLSRFPQMREWIGEKNIKQLSAFKYSLTNKSYEATIEVDRYFFYIDTVPDIGGSQKIMRRSVCFTR